MKKEYKFTWLIDNYSYCWHRTGEALISPAFTADGLGGSFWRIKLYPRGSRDNVKGNISLFLQRSEVGDCLEEITLWYELSFLSVNGSTLHSEKYERTFKSGKSFGWHAFQNRYEILSSRRSEYIPEDKLTVQCKMWIGEGNIQRIIHVKAKTRIGIEINSFIHDIEGLETAEKQTKTFRITSPLKNGLSLTSYLYLTDDLYCEKEMLIEITSSAPNHILTKCNLFLLDEFGNKTECGDVDGRLDITRKEIRIVPLSLTMQEILDTTNDKLPLLLCECTFSTGVESEKIESIVHENPFINIDHALENSLNNSSESDSACPSALDDFKAIYNAQLFTDVELKTKTKSFPAHKIVICARSVVFKTMMTNDMRERNTNIIQVDDVEDDIIQKLLLFLYSDHVENLEWESAVKLYYVADKYEIDKLKIICSSFLADNLSTLNAIELLLLADTHKDLQLKEKVEDFIFKHKDQVFLSNEWENLIETNSRLVSETMLQVYKRK